MSASVPKDIRGQIQNRIWSKADELEWPKCSDLEHAMWYENWAKDKDVGGVLAHFMDPRKVRVYIKDSLLKPYQRTRLEDGLGRVLIVLDLAPETVVFVRAFNKPHGRVLLDGKVICWGNSRDWKAVLLSVFERAYRVEAATPFAAVFFETGKTVEQGMKEMVLDASKRLGIDRIRWLD